MPRRKPAKSTVVRVVQTFTAALWRHRRHAWDAGRPPDPQQRPPPQQQRPLTVSLRRVPSPAPKMLFTTTTTTRNWTPSAAPAAQPPRSRPMWLGVVLHGQPLRRKAATCRCWCSSRMDATCRHCESPSPTAVHVQNRHQASGLRGKSQRLPLPRRSLLLPPGWPEPLEKPRCQLPKPRGAHP